jgi:hypothetical protein
VNYQDDLNNTRSNPWHQPTTFPGQYERQCQERQERFASSLGSSYSAPRSAPRPYDRSNNDVAICALLVAVAITWSVKRLFDLGWETNWQALAITAVATILIARIYFQRHLVLARRIVVTLALALVSVIAYWAWSLSRH